MGDQGLERLQGFTDGRRLASLATSIWRLMSILDSPGCAEPALTHEELGSHVIAT